MATPEPRTESPSTGITFTPSPLAPAPGGAPQPLDTTTPQATLASPGQKLASVLKKGLSITVTCSEACGATVTLELRGGPAKASRRSASRTLVVGKRSVSLPAAGSLKTRVKLKAGGKKALKRVKKAKVVVRTAVRDKAGNERTVTRAVTLKR